MPDSPPGRASAWAGLFCTPAVPKRLNFAFSGLKARIKAVPQSNLALNIAIGCNRLQWLYWQIVHIYQAFLPFGTCSALHPVAP